MTFKILIVLFGIYFYSIAANNEKQQFKVNEGASTSSSGSERELSEEEKCDLDKNADMLVRLLLAEDVRGEDLRDMALNRFEELEYYVQFLNNIFLFATYGPSHNWLGTSVPMQLNIAESYRWSESSARILPNYRERTNYLSFRIIEKCLEIIQEACTNHYRQEMRYIYNPRSNRFAFLENVYVESTSCICNRPAQSYTYCPAGGREIRGLREPALFRFHQQTSYKAYNYINFSKLGTGLSISKHHIIPRILIRAFLKVWLMENEDEVDDGSFSNSIYHGCGQVLYKRLKHSMKKIVMYQVAKATGHSSDYWINYNYQDLEDDDHFFSLLEGLFIESSGGNIFLGPSGRGPLDPSWGLENHLLTGIRGFEFDSEFIIEPQHYQEMIELFHRLYSYVKEAPKLAVSDRLVTGIELCFSMLATFDRYELTLYDPERWEERLLTEEELSRLDEVNRVLCRGVKFWAIKQPPQPEDRTRRSVEDEPNLEKCYSVDGLAKRRWSEFVVEAMKTLLRAESVGESVPWSCDVVKLYYPYRFLSSPGSDCLVGNFDSFLYSKASGTQEWHECVNFSVENPAEWCQAWRRIMLNHNGTRIERYQQDVGIVMSWLSNLVSVERSQVRRVAQNTTNLVCYYASRNNLSSLNCPNACQARPKTNSMSLNSEKIAYDNEWTNDAGKIRCKCPSERNVQVSKTFRFRCDKNSPDFESPRCEDLRR